LFRKSSENANEPVRELTYFLEKWRIKATDVILPIANAVVEDCYKSLSSYYNAVAEKYHEHLAELISDRTKRKETASTQLSDDEKRLQDDFDWLANVNEQLRLIERG
jgi:non-homologous end joining protein Ku